MQQHDSYHHKMTVDYVIVGAGSSGCVLAAKLAKTLKSDSIVVLEGGGTNDYSFVRDFRESLYMPPDEQPKVGFMMIFTDCSLTIDLSCSLLSMMISAAD